jgi:hypothetical protein
MISELPPGANGTTKRMGLAGQVWAEAWVGNSPVKAQAPAAPRKVRLVEFMAARYRGGAFNCLSVASPAVLA